MDTFVVILIVGLAIFYVGRKFFTNLRKSAQPSCGCGCSTCGVQSSCTDSENADGASFHLKR
jgi:hypothetical protein